MLAVQPTYIGDDLDQIADQLFDATTGNAWLVASG
jgi:hypothetical protein